VAADHFVTLLALPRFLLLFKEFLHSVFFDESQIIYHAYSVANSVSPVNGTEPLAREVFALIAEAGFPRQLWALFLQIGTLLVSWSAALTLGHFDAFCLHLMFQC